MQPDPDAAATALTELLAVMARLRDPDGGCPWDRAQDFASIAPYTVEEAYEVADAIRRGPTPGPLLDELGDLLFQVVYHARMAEERGWFDFAAVARIIAEKMIRRHPHVFAADAAREAAAQTAAWEAGKAAERAARAETGTLAGVPSGLPALARAAKLTRRAARVASTGPTPRPCWTSWRRKLRSCARNCPARTARGWPTRSATCCSCWPTLPASWTSTRKPAWTQPIASSRAGSTPWRRALRPAA